MASVIDEKRNEGDVELAEDTLKDGNRAEPEITPEDDKRILRQIDKCLLAVAAISYFFQFLDKTALTSTAIMGLTDDLNLTGEEYSWASGIYYVGYLVASYPAGVMMVKWKVAKTISVSVLVWGSILMLTALCFNAGGLLANRFALGVAEAAIAPGLTVVVSMFYKKSEQPSRHSAWYLGNTFAGMFGGLIQYGIGHIRSIAPWKAVFLILGALTVMWSVCTFILLPDDPHSAWFLKKEDREKAIIRVKENMTGIKNNEFKWCQAREALLDIKTWVLFFIQICMNIPNGAVTGFNAIVIKGFGFDTQTTLLLSCVPYVLQLILVLSATWGSWVFANTRTLWMAWHLAISLTGAALILNLPVENKWGRFGGCVLTMAYSANFPLMMSLMSGNVGGFTKKTSVNAMIFIAYCTGNLIGPQTFLAHESPRYQTGFLTMLICFGIGLVLCIVFRFYVIWVNKKRDQASNGAGTEATDEAGNMVNLLDKTDKEIPQFRYVY